MVYGYCLKIPSCLLYEIVEMRYVIMKSAVCLEQFTWETTSVGLQYLFFWKVRSKADVMEMTGSLILKPYTSLH